MKFYQFKIFILFFLISPRILSSEDSLLVKIGNSGITGNEFRQRFELLPQVTYGVKKDLEQKKNDLLYSIIAEKLWAKEAENLKLDTSDIIQITFKTVEKMFVRDALYKIEIADKIRITDEEKLEGLKRIYTNLYLDVIQINDSATAAKIYLSLENRTSFDSAKILAQINLPPIRIKYGEFKETVEDKLYKLNEGEFTIPINSSSGWLILKLLKKESAAFSKQNEALKDVEGIINQRKTEKYSNEFLDKFFRGRKVETDADLFWNISEKISLIFNAKKLSKSISDSENVYLEVSDLLRIEKMFGKDTLNMSFIKFENEPVTIKQFLREFIFDGFYSAATNQNIISAKLNSRVKTFIEQELLAYEGYRRGLQNLPDVKSSIEMWKDNYRAKTLKNILLDSVKVTDEEVYDHIKNRNRIKNSPMTEVNILEILTDSLEVIEKVLRDLEKGSDFRQLASLHTKRTWTRNNGGEFGFFAVTMYGDIGRISATMNIGEIYGPVKLPEGYSVFKLIDKRQANLDSAASIEDIKEDVAKSLYYKKSVNFFIDYTVKLANKYSVVINEHLMKTIPVSDFNMLIFRQMGFGGRLTAVPAALPFTEWFVPWKESRKLIP